MSRSPAALNAAAPSAAAPSATAPSAAIEPVAAPLAPPAPINQLVKPYDLSAQSDAFGAQSDDYFDKPSPADADRGDTVEPISDLTPEPLAEPLAEPVAEPISDLAPEPTPDQEPESPRIPKARFDEVNNAKKRLAEENERLRAQLAEREPTAPAAPAYDFDGREKAYMDAVLDGDVDKALGIRGEIRTAEHTLMAERIAAATPRAEETANVVQARMSEKNAINSVNTAYPMFDPDSEVYNQDLTDRAVAIAIGYQQQLGMSFVQAISEAADQVATLNGVGRASTTPTPPPAPAVTPTQVKNKLAQASAQPPQAPTATRSDEAGVDPSAMTDEEFDKLPSAVKARHRGDFL